jgi:hypothetical protein
MTPTVLRPHKTSHRGDPFCSGALGLHASPNIYRRAGSVDALASEYSGETPGNGPAWSCSFHLHGDAKVAKTLKESLGELFLVPLFEVLMAEVTVFDAIAKHEVRRGQHRAGDGENGFLRAAPTLDAEELSTQVAVRFARGGPRRIDQCGFEPGRGPSCPRRPPLAGAFVETWAQAGPRDQMTNRREAAHVRTDFCDKDARRRLTEARHGRQEADGGSKGTQRVSNARLDRRDRCLEGVDLGQVQFDHEPMMVGDATMDRVAQIRPGRLQPPRGEIDEAIGIRFTGDQRVEDRSAADAHMSLMTCVSFRLASSSVF